MQAGFPPAVISPEQKDEYIDAQRAAQLKGDTEPLRLFIAQCVQKSLDKYLNAASKAI